MSGPYEDIIDLPHPTSTRHPRMPMASRAAQFSPFAALTGYGDAVQEASRFTGRKAELTEEEKSLLDAKLRLLAARSGDGTEAHFTYFRPDGRKEGGAYLTVTGSVGKIDSQDREVVLTDGRRIPVDDILEIESDAPESHPRRLI